jgi:hypothetical protein
VPLWGVVIAKNKKEGVGGVSTINRQPRWGFEKSHSLFISHLRSFTQSVHSGGVRRRSL